MLVATAKEQTFRVIFNCKCKVVRAFDYKRENVKMFGQMTAQFYRMGGEVKIYSYQDAKCSCGKRVKETFVHGIYNPEHKCDVRCLTAKGKDCTCECGGEGHGKAYILSF